MDYTKQELNEFRSLIEKTESRDQLTRIEGRLDLQTFICRVGKEKCDAMFEVIKLEAGG